MYKSCHPETHLALEIPYEKAKYNEYTNVVSEQNEDVDFRTSVEYTATQGQRTGL